MKELKQNELCQINGGIKSTLSPNTLTTFLTLAHAVYDFASGFGDRFTKHATK